MIQYADPRVRNIRPLPNVVYLSNKNEITLAELAAKVSGEVIEIIDLPQGAAVADVSTNNTLPVRT